MKTASIVLLVLALTVPGFAGVIFALGNDPQPDEQNVLFVNGPTAMGVTDKTGALVNFSSTTDDLIITASGQANLTAVDGLINNISIALGNGLSYGSLILNPFSGGTAAGPALITVATNEGLATFTYDLGKGNNFLTITTSGGSLIGSTTVASAGGFEALRQVRISDITAIPEPATLLLLGGGLVLLGLIRKRVTRR